LFSSVEIGDLDSKIRQVPEPFYDFVFLTEVRPITFLILSQCYSSQKYFVFVLKEQFPQIFDWINLKQHKSHFQPVEKTL